MGGKQPEPDASEPMLLTYKQAAAVLTLPLLFVGGSVTRNRSE